MSDLGVAIGRGSNLEPIIGPAFGILEHYSMGLVRSVDGLRVLFEQYSRSCCYVNIEVGIGLLSEYPTLVSKNKFSNLEANSQSVKNVVVLHLKKAM